MPMRGLGRSILLLLAACSLALAADNKPPIWECYKITAARVVDPVCPDGQVCPDPGANYEVTALNACPYEVERVYVLVKFFDAGRYRIGVDAFGGKHIAPGERLKTLVPIPYHLGRKARYVGVRKITDKAFEALEP